MKRRTTGLVLGKFLPPTRGHQYLIDFARHYCDDLTVVVGTLQREPIPGRKRYEWMCEMFPGVRVVHLTDENPQYPHEHPDFWAIWRASLRRFLAQGCDYVFASEDYGRPLAEVMGGEWVPVDCARQLVPVSATAVREDPMGRWDYLPEVVRPWFLRRVLILGAESTGKTTLAAELAREFHTCWVHEYARPLIEALGGEVTSAMFERIVRGQKAAEEAMARQANRLLICDTDAFTSALFHEVFLGSRPGWLVELARRARWDLVLLCAPDTPYVDDPQRKHEHYREWFHAEYLGWIRSCGLPFVLIEGGWDQRFATARNAVQHLLDLPESSFRRQI